MIEIFTPRWRSQKHIHKCPICKKLREEPNDVCRKETTDAHIYPCLGCLSDYRRRFGAFSDELLDGYFENEAQKSLIAHVVPDHVSDDLDLRDAENRRVQALQVDTRKEKPAPVKLPTAQELKDFREQLLDEADRVGEEELMYEWEKIQKDEKL